MRVLLIGSSGLVGQIVLTSVLADPRFTEVVALTRASLPPHPKLLNPIADFRDLPLDAAWWSVDGVICTLGTTLRKAGSESAFREVDHDFPLAVARAAFAKGTRRFALNSALGADAASRFFYNRVKGETERDLAAIGFTSLAFVRPGLIDGSRAEFRLGERAGLLVSRIVSGVLPARLRPSRADRIAAELVKAIAEPKPGIRIVSSAELA